MKIKICGMRQPENIESMVALNPDYIGFIFYRSSKRFINDLPVQALDIIPAGIKKTGVFVDAQLEEIQQMVSKYNLDCIQLHGSESAAICKEVKEFGVEVIKAFGINEDFDFSVLDEYNTVCDYFLFDTKTDQHGGSGQAFDWKILSNYKLSKPYFLSGGLSLENLGEIKLINDDRLFAVDLNSKFETQPGLKDIKKFKEAIKLIRE